MRFVKVGCAMLIAASGAVAAEAKKPNGTRTVQVIVMAPASSSAAAEAPSAGAGIGDEGRAAAPPTISSEFRAHDLSRRWVEFDMGSSFESSAPTTSAPQPIAGNADPFARVGVARLAGSPRAATLPPTSIVGISDWMRSGLAFSGAVSRFAPGCAAGGYRPTSFLRPDAEGRRFGYYPMMSNIACEYGIPVGLFDAMIIRESRYRPDIFSPKNAFGLTQLMPETAAGLGVDRYDVEQNLRGGARYLRQQLDRFGQVHLALAAYNAGPGRIRNGLVPQIAETQDYVDRVLLDWRRLTGVKADPRPTTIRTAAAPIRPEHLRKPDVLMF